MGRRPVPFCMRSSGRPVSVAGSALLTFCPVAHATHLPELPEVIDDSRPMRGTDVKLPVMHQKIDRANLDNRGEASHVLAHG
jgi:hypothetical protein